MIKIVNATQAAIDSYALLPVTTDIPLSYWVAQNAIIKVVELDGVPIGLVFISNDKEIASYIHSDFQRNGYATEAGKLLIAEAKSIGITKVTAKTKIVSSGEKLAKSFGLIEIGRDQNEIFWELEI